MEVMKEHTSKPPSCSGPKCLCRCTWCCCNREQELAPVNRSHTTLKASSWFVIGDAGAGSRLYLHGCRHVCTGLCLQRGWRSGHPWETRSRIRWLGKSHPQTSFHSCVYKGRCANGIIRGHLVLIFHYHHLETSSVPLSFHSDPHWDM